MGNDQVQAPVQLEGRGLVRRSSQHYEPGEYKEFQNLVVTPYGTLKKRDPVQGLMLSNANPHPLRFIGHSGHQAILAGIWMPSGNPIGSLFVCKETTATRLDVLGTEGAFEALLQAKSAFGAGSRSFSFEGFLTYNDKYHIIVAHTLESALDPYKIYVASLTGTGVADDLVSLNLGAFTISDPIYSASQYVAGGFLYPRPVVTSHLLHKDRLFIAIHDTVYFSKTADFLQWEVADDGGFFKFPGKTIRKIVSIGDSIYVIFDTSVSVITYSSGPNLDAQVRVISEVIGGEDAVGYEGSIYLGKSDAIYVINGGNISKLLDLELGPILDPSVLSTDTFDFKMAVYDSGLYLIPKKTVKVGGNSHPVFVRYSAPTPMDIYGAYTPAGIYRIDLDSGTVSNYIFGNGAVNSVADAQFVSIEDKYNAPKLVFFSNYFSEGSWLYSLFYFGSPEILRLPSSSPKVGFHALDSFSNSLGTALNFNTIPILLHISRYSPDTMLYFQKKFRSIMIQANVGKWEPDTVVVPATALDELELIVEAGAAFAVLSVDDYREVSTLIDKPLSGPSVRDAEDISENAVRAFRYGVNQRATSIEIIIRTTDLVRNDTKAWTEFEGAGTDHPWQVTNSLLEIVDIRTLWTYLKRLNTNNPNDLS